MADHKQETTPFVDAMLEYSAREPGRFQVPGHKGGIGADPAMVALIGMTGLINDIPSVTEGVDTIDICVSHDAENRRGR